MGRQQRENHKRYRQERAIGRQIDLAVFPLMLKSMAEQAQQLGQMMQEIVIAMGRMTTMVDNVIEEGQMNGDFEFPPVEGAILELERQFDE